MIFFEDAFELAGLEPRLGKIITTPLPPKPILIRVDSVASIFNKEGLDPGKDDYSLWQALADHPMGQNVKTILKNCLSKYKIEFNPLELNKLGKDEAIRVFFHIFSIEPKSGKKTRPPRDSPEEMRFWVERIMGKPEEHLELNAEDLGRITSGKSLEEAVAAMSDAELLAVTKNLLTRLTPEARVKEADNLPDRLLKGFFLRIFGPRPTKDAGAQANPEEADGQKDADFMEPLQPAARISLPEAQAIFNSARKVPASERLEHVDVTDIRIFENMPITLKDHVYLLLTSPGEIFAGCVMLINPNNDKVLGVGHLEMGLKKDDNSEDIAPHLLFEAQDLDFSEFKNQSILNLALVPSAQAAFFEQKMTPEKAKSYHGELYMLEQIHRSFQQLPETGRVLCIDFGTSNTTAGTYGAGGELDESISLVTFQDTTDKKPAISELLPTMVYVQSCAPGTAPIFLYGYDAKKKLIESDYAPRGSFFFELKRWLTDLEKEEPIEDENGNEVRIRREDIVFAYLDYVITTAEQQFKTRFKKLHFSAPVKQKEIFLEWLENIFRKRSPDREILPADESLDEGMAIVYYTAMNYLKGNCNKMDILILDCGGGTTDLASCKCEYIKNELANELRITPGFENGDSNFGGNNITFRVMQMIKIKIARQLEAMRSLEQMLATGSINEDKINNLVDKKVISQEDADLLCAQGLPDRDELVKIVQKHKTTMESLLDLDENQILTQLDSSELGQDENILDMKRKIYEKFEKAYAEAEKYVPTRFKEYELRNEKALVRRNFYYLWQMAEAIKIKFYKSNIVNMDFARNEALDTIIDLGDLDRYYLSVRRDGTGPLEKKEKPLEHMEITFKEIDRILCADIYTLLNILLNFENPLNYRYCLSGQSCKIALFHNLLKEFIPGKNLRQGLSTNGENSRTNSDILKKYCIEGSIEYNRDRARGSIQPFFKPGEIRRIYDIVFSGGPAPEDEKALFRPGNDDELLIEPLLRPRNTRELKFIIRDRVNVVKNEISYLVLPDSQTPHTLEQVKATINGHSGLPYSLLQKHVFDVLQNLQEKYTDRDFYCFFALPDSRADGFRIFQIDLRHENDGSLYYYMPDKPLFTSYENEKLLTFFDGKR